MLNEDKIKLMTELSLYEKKQKRRVFAAERYFKSDYISKYMLLAFFKYTVSFLLLLFLFGLFQFDMLMGIIRIEDVIFLLTNIVILYLIGLFVFEVITYFVWAKKYDRSKRTQDKYIYKLRTLKKRYDFQSKSKEISKEDLSDDSFTGV